MVTASEIQGMVQVPGVVVLPFSPRHMDSIVTNPVDRRIFESLPDLRQRLEAVSQQRCAWTLNYRYEAALVMGMEYKYPTNYEAWIVPSDVALKHGTLLSRGARRFFDKIGERLNLRRMQIVVNVNHEPAIRWAEFLRFNREGLMSNYGPEGDDYYMYARTY